MLLRNSVIANHLNSGVYLSRNIAEIANCTIYGNTSYGVFTNNNTQQIRNSIIWGNGDNLYNFASGKVNYCCLQEGGDIGLGVHNFSLYPVFKNVANKDFHLWHSSACIDAGDPNSAFSNEPSPNGGIINVGAYGNTGEAQVSFTDADEDGISDGWEHYHWPNDDPNEHDPNDDTDGDDLCNRMNIILAGALTLMMNQIFRDLLLMSEPITGIHLLVWPKTSP